MNTFFNTLITPDALLLFARGGGGGSGGGSGGGGSGEVIALLGYIPTHLVGGFFRKRMHNPAGLALTCVCTAVYAGLWLFLGSFGILVAIAALVGGPAGYFGWFGKFARFARRAKRARQGIAEAYAKDPAWHEEAMNKHVNDVFLQFQKDWSVFNVDAMRSYITEPYLTHVHLMMAAIYQRRRRNVMEDVKILETYPVSVIDSPDNSQDRVSYLIHASAKDKLVENVNGVDTTIFTDTSEFGEIWHFVRVGHTWLLENIEQTTANGLLLSGRIRSFASQNQLYYSQDWGWLLLPRRGVLFGKGKFGNSDINNHVIGLYNNLLIELYSYIPNTKRDSPVTYTIAQVGLPKRYESIIVEAKKGWSEDLFPRTPKGYNKLSLEWPDFNKRYRVYATDIEQVTAFELLHPAYMEKLFALPFKVSIEVVDNVVYLYTTDKNADYNTMLSILKDAFKEMKL